MSRGEDVDIDIIWQIVSKDLLALVAILEAPKNSLVVYGQPYEGVVVVKVDETIKEKAKKIIQAMEPLPKS